MKDKAFARGVQREDLVKDTDLLSISIDAHVGYCLRAMQAEARLLGLQGIDGRAESPNGAPGAG